MGCALASDSRGFTSLVLVCDGFHVARLHAWPRFARFRKIASGVLQGEGAVSKNGGVCCAKCKNALGVRHGALVQ